MGQTNLSLPNGQKLGWFIFECVMAVLYLMFGIIFLCTPFFSNVIEEGGWRIALGAVVCFYGIVRLIRAIRKIIQRS